VITPSRFTLRRVGPADAAAVITVLDAARARSAHLRVLRETGPVRVRSEAWLTTWGIALEAPPSFVKAT
jgi:hypothetical protein